MTLSDLTFLEEGNPDFTPDGLINWQKRTLLSRLLNELTESQRLSNFDLTQTPMLESFSRQLNASKSTITEHYARSLDLEPRDAKPNTTKVNKF